jgi:hypothetical protein
MGKRQLTNIEKTEAQLVFGDSIAYDSVWLNEEVSWPDWVARVGALISRSEPPPHNAITLGYRIYIPVILRTSDTTSEDAFLKDMGWLIHELTHNWQFQHDGPIYLFQALWTQLKLGSNAYDYGGEQGLEQYIQQGKRLRDFNREQQGEIARDYYHRMKKGQDTTAWEPFIQEFSNR